MRKDCGCAWKKHNHPNMSNRRDPRGRSLRPLSIVSSSWVAPGGCPESRIVSRSPKFPC